MHKTYHTSERGQVIVFLVVGLVVFLGFVGLAIDGGMAYSDRRYAQNSSDASSLAGGGEAALYLENSHIYYNDWDCTDPAIEAAISLAETKAVERAATNGFVIDYDFQDYNGVEATCGSEYYYDLDYTDNYIDVEVKIYTTTETSFAHLLFPDVLQITVDSTTRIRPRQPWVLGNAIVALNPEACDGHENGGVYYGNSNVDVSGGGIWSNGCLKGNGHPFIVVDGAGIRYAGEFEPGNAIWDPYPPDDPTEYQIPPALYDPGEFDCFTHEVDNSDIPRDGTLLEPGLYCFQGDFIVNAHDKVIGEGVTFVVYGDITFNGKALIQISAPQLATAENDAIPGVLIYVPRDPPNATCPDQTITINGNSESYFVGLILAPCADITLIGTGSSDSYNGQVVGWNVKVGGEADTSVIFNEKLPEGLATRIELYR